MLGGVGLVGGGRLAGVVMTEGPREGIAAVAKGTKG